MEPIVIWLVGLGVVNPSACTLRSFNSWDVAWHKDHLGVTSVDGLGCEEPQRVYLAEFQFVCCHAAQRSLGRTGVEPIVIWLVVGLGCEEPQRVCLAEFHFV